MLHDVLQCSRLQPVSGNDSVQTPNGEQLSKPPLNNSKLKEENALREYLMAWENIQLKQNNKKPKVTELYFYSKAQVYLYIYNVKLHD